jgi:hypothetical protein
LNQPLARGDGKEAEGGAEEGGGGGEAEEEEEQEVVEEEEEQEVEEEEEEAETSITRRAPSDSDAFSPRPSKPWHVSYGEVHLLLL